LFLSTLRIFTKWQERKLTEENEKLEKTVAERTEEVVKEKNESDKQRQRSDELLLNILPKEVAEELKLRGSFEPKYFDHVTIMFTDFKNFTQITSKMTPKELVEEIHTCFKAFDIIIEKYGMEKIKTIGDSYMCAGGLPVGNTTHAIDVVGASLEIRQFILNRVAEQTAAGKQPFEMRIGIHTGPVVAGVVGSKKFAYDIWGDTVNTASRIETNGEVGKVNISAATYEWIKDTFKCVHRGKIQVKGKEDIDMYFVEERM
jgi:class 3 adenylate cyclase